MKKNIKKIIKVPFILVADYLYYIFGSAAENHIRLQKKRDTQGIPGRFPSYFQFKRSQKKARRNFLLVLLFLFGMLVSQLLFPSMIKTEVYIPEGESDILISNVKKDRATIVFKTLDAANFNKPLATTAVIYVYADPELKNLVETTDPDDYAVTHMMNISNLEENKKYYLKIIATDSSENKNAKNTKELAYIEGKQNYLMISTENLKTGELSCEEKLSKEIAKAKLLTAMIKEDNENDFEDAEVINGVPVAPKIDEPMIIGEENSEKASKQTEDKLGISNIMHENALYATDKIQTIVSWKTNKPSSTVAIYREGKGGEEREVSIGGKIATSHMAVFTNFKPDTVYYFKVKSVAENGENAVSDEFSFLTPKKKEGIGEVIVNNFKQIFKQILPGK